MSAAPRTGAPVSTHTVIVYSDDPKVRDSVRGAIGRRPAGDIGRIEWVECATGPDLIRLVDKGGVDLVILDGEAWPTGGLGLARQMKGEVVDAPPCLGLIARRDDRWLAPWAMAGAGLPPAVDAPGPVPAAGGLPPPR